jgi:hypothetical protein
MTASLNTQKKSKLLKEFDSLCKKGIPLLEACFGKEETIDLKDEILREYEAIIPRIPYLGGMEPFTRFMISTAQYIVIYRVLKGRGLSLEEVGELIYDLTEKVVNEQPRFLLRILSGSRFSKRYIQRVRKVAEETQKRLFPENYVFRFVEGDGVEFDYGIDYTECGPCKFLEAEGVPELGPYLCVLDEISSDKFNWGLRRTMTIAEGDPVCDFRFKKNGGTRIESSIR